MIRKYLLLLAVTAGSVVAYAQKSYNQQVIDYIERFKDLAVAEQLRTGVPASIKLAQGIYETGAGSSELCNNASNHFGIKCKSNWIGDTYTYTDDAKDECFRKYESAMTSYKDHSDFLKTNKRYSSLFELSPTDYAAWAYGLKRCGYATNPAYAKKIIKTIEDYKLQEFTYAALGKDGKGEEVLYASATPQPLTMNTRVAARTAGEHVPVNDGYETVSNATYSNEGYAAATTRSRQEEKQASGNNVTTYYESASKNGKKGFYAKKGDMLLEYAIKNKMRYAKLLEMNDLPDAPLEADMFIYLERKARIGSNAIHTVENGETLLQISQQEGMQLAQLRAYNLLAKNEEPAAGSRLNLQSTASLKPEVSYATAGSESTGSATASGRNTTVANDGYIATKKTTYSTPEHVVAQVEEDVVESATTASPTKVNIANERPVEEMIAEERASRSEATQQNNVSALDKLKAHMDKTVYAGKKEFEPKSTRNYDNSNEEEVEETVTIPARKTATTTASNATISKAQNNKKSAATQKKEQLAAKAKSKAATHTVRKGETLFGIAEKYDLSLSQLQKLNKLGGAKKITPGMKLKVK